MHELRDVLTRNGIPIEFFPVESDPACVPLEESGHTGSKLPVVITYTGHALADPTNDELGAAFGLAARPASTVNVAMVGAGPPGCPLRSTPHRRGCPRSCSSVKPSAARLAAAR